jgi:hypothetical protein
MIAAARPHIMQKFSEAGFGIGALVRCDYRGHMCLVEQISWVELDHSHVPEELGAPTHRYPNRVQFVGRKIDDGKIFTFNMTLVELAKSLLSPTNKNGRNAPSGWAQGTIYDEERWFDKKTSRAHFFIENNALSS